MIFDKLLEWPSKKIHIIVTLIAGLSFLILTILFRVFGNEATATGYGILEFEFGFTAQQIGIIFNAWNTFIFQQQTLGVYLDFVYIPSYALLLGGLVLWLTRQLEGKMQQIGLLFTVAPIIAGVFDFIENVGLLLMLNDVNSYINGTASDLIPMITSICAFIKFGLLILAIAFFLISLIYWLVKRKSEN
ncbi:MAG: hypothetical protein ACFFC7_19370 [Candidatus Hermodarchaeota archaeon]